jgi:spermidine synthase
MEDTGPEHAHPNEFESDAPSIGKGRLGVLFFSIFVIAACGLAYELLIGAVATYLLGNSVLQYSLTIGVFLAAMGIGSALSRFVSRRLLHVFVAAEVLLGLIGGLSGALLFLAFSYTDYDQLVMFTLIIVVGSLVGVEIPLLTRFVRKSSSLREAIANVLSFDYLGALVTAILFPLVLLPFLGLVKTGVAVGLLNLLVAGLTLKVFSAQLRPSPLSWGLVGACSAGLVAMLFLSGPMLSFVEKRLYRDPVVHAEQTQYQRVVITQYKDDTRLYLDGHLQMSTRDEYRYHESLVHPAMGISRSREVVLILGGGDGAAVREVLTHDDVKKVVLVDLDPGITRLARENKFLSLANKGALDDPRVEVINTDAYRYLEESTELFPVIIMDFPDPRSESLAKLYSRSFYQLVQKRLAKGGVAVSQATSPFFAKEAFWCAVTTAEQVGLFTLPYHTYIPSFGDWGFFLMAEHRIQADQLKVREGLRYLTPALIPGMLTFPADMARPTGEDAVKENRLDHPVILQYYEAGYAKWF